MSSRDDNMWVVTARVTDKIKSMNGIVTTGLGDWTRATFPTEAVAQEFDGWLATQTINGRLIKSQGVSYLASEGEYMVRFK